MKFSRCSMRWALVGLLSLAVLSGCDSNPPPGSQDPDGGPKVDLSQADTQSPPTDAYKLNIIGNSTFTLKPGEQATLKVGYMKNEALQVGKAITFTVKGDAKDTVFTTFTAITDNVGVAQTIATAGQVAAGFQIEASAFGATPVQFTIQVVIPPPPVPKLAGVFTLVSNFDVSTPFDGSTLANVLNILDEMSNHSDDPGRYIVDIIYAEAFKGLDPSVQTALNFFKPVLYAQVQALLLKYIPTIVTDVKSIAKSLSDLARRFQITSSLISATEQPSDKLMMVSHKLEKIGWTLNGKKKEYGYVDLGLKNPQADNVGLVLNTTGLTISEHSFGLQLGSFLLVGLNELIIPLINPSASSFTGLLTGWVDCTTVGKTINDNVGMLGEAFWKGACDAALKAVGSLVESQITKINVGTSSLNIAGTCQISDQNKDVYLDTIQNGLWVGTFTFVGNTAKITGAANNFSGTRTK